MARIAIVTSEVGLRADPDLEPIAAALRADGAIAEPVAWDANAAAWDKFDLAIIRSTWDYTGRVDEFLAWADTTASRTRLWNPAPMVRWNSHKRYLLDLADHGVAVVPTQVIRPGGRYRPEDFDGPDGVVVKPAISAGARDTARYGPGQQADVLSHVRTLLEQGRPVLVQPYLPLVAEGERALVFFAGRFSHAIRKGPVLTEAGMIDNLRTPHVDVVAYRPTGAEIDTAVAALAAVPWPEPALFARVDLALDGTRKPVVMELELIEPNLFLGMHPDGLERFVSAAATQAGMGPC